VRLKYTLRWCRTAEAFNKAIKKMISLLCSNTPLNRNSNYQIEKLEEQRIECVKTSLNLGAPGAVSKLHQIMEKLPEQWRQKFSSILASLKQKINDLSKLNASNQILIEEAIGFIGNKFSFLSRQTEIRPVRYYWQNTQETFNIYTDNKTA
jgi:hypothetical protein